jgi:ribosome biogenesis GTPase A
MSKRQTLRKKFSIQRHVREHHRDVRKAIKKVKKESGTRPSAFQSERAVLKVPMKDTSKEELLRLAIAARAEGKIQKKLKKTAVKSTVDEVALAEAAVRRQESAKAKKLAEDQDFTLQLAKCLAMSSIFIHVVDARAPNAGLSENLTLAAEVHKLPVLILLTKTDLVPVEVVEAWVKHLKKLPGVFDVMPYDATTLVSTLQRKFGMGTKVYATIAGLPNAGLRTLTANLTELQGGRVSVHPSKEAAKGRVPHSNEIVLLTLPHETTFNQQNVCGLDCVYRSWQFIVNNLKDVELHAEEVVKYFEPKALCTFYRMALVSDTSPGAILQAIARRRSLTDVREAARLVLVDYNTGKLQWCCVPPGVTHIRDGWTVIDEAFLSTQDYNIITNEA